MDAASHLARKPRKIPSPGDLIDWLIDQGKAKKIMKVNMVEDEVLLWRETGSKELIRSVLKNLSQGK
jgi:hypothetical protein